MSCTRAILAGLAAGFGTNFVMHLVWFLVISFCIGIAAAILFAKSRGSWAEEALLL